MEKGQGKGTDTLQTDNVFTRKEYIERDAAVMKIREWFWSAPGVHPKLSRDTAEEILFAIPAADVVARDCYDRLLAENDELRKERPVVRCKDCEYWDATQEAPLSEGCFLCTLEGGYPKGDFYCALGERRMDGDGE